MDTMDNRELISALADGQLRGEAFAQAVRLAGSDAGARSAWHTYHLIGDVLRSGELAAGSDPQAFVSRLQARLRSEAAAGQAPLVPAPAPELGPLQRLDRHGEAANDASGRWKLAAGFASFAAVAALAWNVLGVPGKVGQPQMAGVAAPQVAAGTGSERPAMIRDPRLDEFLAAHRQYGGATALQAPAGFLRNATYEGPAR